MRLTSQLRGATTLALIYHHLQTTTCKHCYKVVGNATLAPRSPEAICSTLGSTGFGTPAICSRGWDQESCSTVPWFRSTNKAEGVIQPAAYKFSVVGSELKG